LYVKVPIYPGVRFGKLTVVRRRRLTLSRIDRRGKKHYKGKGWWVLRCDCGRLDTITTHYLLGGQRLTCGICPLGRRRNPYLPYGFFKRKGMKYTYRSFYHMKSRCLDPKSRNYPNYGGRGVTVCARWLAADGFLNFLADMGKRPRNQTLDRKNPFGNYEPSNCRWATNKIQALNKRAAWEKAGGNPFGNAGEIVDPMEQDPMMAEAVGM
jgi:hypothetical protein